MDLGPWIQNVMVLTCGVVVIAVVLLTLNRQFEKDLVEADHLVLGTPAADDTATQVINDLDERCE